MSKPNLNNKNAADGAISELISGLSALHMDCLEIENAEPDAFIDERFYWAKHSREHFEQSVEYINQLNKLQNIVATFLLHQNMDVDFNDTEQLGKKLWSLRQSLQQI